jgi:hypothetical protein
VRPPLGGWWPDQAAGAGCPNAVQLSKLHVTIMLVVRIDDVDIKGPKLSFVMAQTESIS